MLTEMQQVPNGLQHAEQRRNAVHEHVSDYVILVMHCLFIAFILMGSVMFGIVHMQHFETLRSQCVNVLRVFLLYLL